MELYRSTVLSSWQSCFKNYNKRIKQLSKKIEDGGNQVFYSWSENLQISKKMSFE